MASFGALPKAAGASVIGNAAARVKRGLFQVGAYPVGGLAGLATGLIKNLVTGPTDRFAPFEGILPGAHAAGKQAGRRITT
jgi:hypothetical protein